jgi:hypothetical protein
MDFSDSRKRQRTYRDEETESVESKQRVLNEIDKVCAAVNVKILTTNERQCIYKVADYVKGGSLRPINSSVNLVHRDGFLNELLEEIAITFKDCLITLDPTETYITIDWS